MASTNLTHNQTHQEQTSWYIILRLTFENSEIVYRFKLIMLDRDHFILESIPESNTDLIPNGVRLNETWTQREYELIDEPNRQLIPQREHEFVSFNLNLINFE